MFNGQSIQLERTGDAVAELSFDRRQQSINKLE
jgi:hypothetical protein